MKWTVEVDLPDGAESEASDKETAESLRAAVYGIFGGWATVKVREGGMMKSLLQKKAEVVLAKPVNVRLSEESHAVLEALAKFTGRSMSELAVHAVEEALRTVQRDEDFKRFLAQQGALTPMMISGKGRGKAEGAA